MVKEAILTVVAYATVAAVFGMAGYVVVGIFHFRPPRHH
jgi:hypothetical protein